MPSGFTETEKQGYRRVVGMLMKGDPARKADLDAKAAKVLADLRGQVPEATAETLAEFTAVTSLIGMTFLRSSVENATLYARGIYEVYSVVTAQLINVYDPAEEAPNNVIPDVMAALGLDDETAQKIMQVLNMPDEHPHSERLEGMFM